MTILLILLGIYAAGAIAVPIALRHWIYSPGEWLLAGLLWPWWVGGAILWWIVTRRRFP